MNIIVALCIHKNIKTKQCGSSRKITIRIPIYKLGVTDDRVEYTIQHHRPHTSNVYFASFNMQYSVGLLALCTVCMALASVEAASIPLETSPSTSLQESVRKARQVYDEITIDIINPGIMGAGYSGTQILGGQPGNGLATVGSQPILVSQPILGGLPGNGVNIPPRVQQSVLGGTYGKPMRKLYL